MVLITPTDPASIIDFFDKIWPQVQGICCDHRRLATIPQPGMVMAISGRGHDHWTFVLAQQPLVIITDRWPFSKQPPCGQKIENDTPPFILVCENLKKILSYLAKKFYPQQVPTQVAITGTNGKSSCVDMVRQIMALTGQKSASIGTIGTFAQDGPITTALDLFDYPLTTPDAIDFHRALSRLAQQEQRQFLAFEASSHGLDQYRIHGAKIQAAGWTNFTHDHLDYHGNEESYFQAKLRLMTEVLPLGGFGIIHNECHFQDRIAKTLNTAGKVPIMVGKEIGQKIRPLVEVVNTRFDGVNTLVYLRIDGKAYDPVVFGLPGQFQIDNLLVCLGIVYCLGLAPESFLPVCENLHPIKGRMELVASIPSTGKSMGSGIFVDYAHTPDALGRALQSLRSHTPGNIGVVFGCGGNRDSHKRSIMGRIAASLSDWVIVTDDNPRWEDPYTIRQQILVGCYEVVGSAHCVIDLSDRRHAIAEAIKKLRPGDNLLIAGKGHESCQETQGVYHHFEDQTVIRDILLADNYL